MLQVDYHNAERHFLIDTFQFGEIQKTKYDVSIKMHEVKRLY